MQADSLLSDLPGKPRKNRMVLLLQKKFHILSNYNKHILLNHTHTLVYTHKLKLFLASPTIAHMILNTEEFKHK